MSFKTRPEVSTKNKYWIPKHRYYELKHFCLQYPTWKNAYNNLDIAKIPTTNFEFNSLSSDISNPTEKIAILKFFLSDKIRLIEQTAIESDETLHMYILKAVTEGLSYDYLKTTLQIPCGRDMYYDRYRKFFWILSSYRG